MGIRFFFKVKTRKDVTPNRSSIGTGLINIKSRKKQERDLPHDLGRSQ